MGGLFSKPKLPPTPEIPPAPEIPVAVEPPVSGDADTLLATLKKKKTQTIFGGAQNAFAGPTGNVAIKTLLGQ